MRTFTLILACLVSVFCVDMMAVAQAPADAPKQAAGPQWNSEDLQLFMKALAEHDVDKVNKLLAEKPNLVKAKSPSGATPLHMVARPPKPVMPRPAPAAEQAAKPQTSPQPAAQADAGSMEAYRKALEKQRAMADLLIRKGAAVNAQDDTGATPMHYLLSRHAPGAGKSPQPEGSATQKPAPPSAATQMTKPAEKTKASQENKNAAMLEHQKTMMEMLLKQGGNPTVKDKAGVSPQEKATQMNREDLLELMRRMQNPPAAE